MHFFRNQIFLVCALLLALSTQGYTQYQHYDFSAKLDIPLLSAGAAGTVTSLILRDNNKPLGLEQLNELDVGKLMDLDMQATGNYSLSSQKASDVLLTASYALPLSTLLIPEARKDLGIISIMLAESILLTETLTGITKNLVNRPRPYAFNTDLADDIRIDDNNNLSFFSGHTSYTAMFSFFTASVLSNYIENQTTRHFVWAGAILLPAATGFYRYDGGKHFITDVVAGYAVGAAIGYLIPRLHEVEKEKTSPNSFHLDRKASQPFRLVFVF